MEYGGHFRPHARNIQGRGGSFLAHIGGWEAHIGPFQEAWRPILEYILKVRDQYGFYLED